MLDTDSKGYLNKNEIDFSVLPFEKQQMLSEVEHQL